MAVGRWGEGEDGIDELELTSSFSLPVPSFLRLLNPQEKLPTHHSFSQPDPLRTLLPPER